MTRWIVQPEVAGQLGDKTVMDNRMHPPVVSKLHYVFDGWLGDDLLTSFPCYIVTERLASALRSSTLTGWKLEDVLVSKSQLFDDLHPGRMLPRFCWLVVDGTEADDMCIGKKHRLEVSDRVLQLLRRFKINNASVKAVAGRI